MNAVICGEQKRYFTLRSVSIHSYNCDMISEVTLLIPEYKKTVIYETG